IIASLEQVLDLNRTSFEDIIGRLKAYEERILDDENSVETQGKLFFSNTTTQENHSSYDNSRGRGRGRGRGLRGRGRGRFNSQDRNKEKKDRS
ncbi:hypothetical protein, partial [Escherichia coli]|uniref:hypothetical protein n=1 Tax=Escherichia coli TaxID=562 RepID=UPI001C56F83A|nr:hypothetical protein [Escherichia coli]